MQYVHYKFLVCKEVTNDTEMCKRENHVKGRGPLLDSRGRINTSKCCRLWDNDKN